MKRTIIAIIISIVTILSFAMTAQAEAGCDISLTGVSSGTSSINVSFNASAGCAGTFYAYVVNYTTDTDLVFSSIAASGGSFSRSFGFSGSANVGDNIHLNLYHMGTGGDSSANWNGTASSSASALGGGCSADGRLNADSCGGDNFAAYVSESDAVSVWTATGDVAFQVPARTINAMPEQVNENTLVRASSDQTYRLYKLTSGEYQLMVRKPDGKTSVMIFNLPYDGTVTTREE
ncbi:MAG: hypothetical protein CL607_07390 [Anaerolineaceae bacterium]|nr:hypothetical protein [Anaerolineaceae bacterium]